MKVITLTELRHRPSYSGVHTVEGQIPNPNEYDHYPSAQGNMIFVDGEWQILDTTEFVPESDDDDGLDVFNVMEKWDIHEPHE